MILTTTINPYTDPAHHTLPAWGGKRFAQAYARQHGESKVWLASGKVLRYWMDADRLRQRTYARVIVERP